MLKPLTYTPFTTGELRPAGWLKKQLEIQAAGLSGHLDKIWPDVRDSRMDRRGTRGWERVPYWLDGFIPLAWLLEDEDMRPGRAVYRRHPGPAAGGWLAVPLHPAGAGPL